MRPLPSLDVITAVAGAPLLAVAGLAVLFLTACCRHAVVTAATTAKPRHALATQPAAEPAPEDDELDAVRRLQALLCKEDPNCCVRQIMPAGKSARGQALSVVSIGHVECLIPESAAPVADEDGTSEDGDADGEWCEDYWLVAGAPDPQPLRQLATQCAAPRLDIFAGTDEVARTFTYGDASVGSNSQLGSQVVIGLDPLRLSGSSGNSVDVSLGFQHYDHSWDWDTFEGVLGIGVDHCPGTAPPDLPAVDSDVPFFDIEAVAIPRIALPAEFVDGAWRNVGLGRCAARIGAASERFVIQGAPTAEGDAQIRAVLSTANQLFVEVEDDHLIAGKRGWVGGDHLAIWVSPAKACVDPRAPSAEVQWAIGVLDGRVHRGSGRPSATLSVQTERTDHGVRMRIDLGKVLTIHDRLTLAYSDSDDGVHPKSVFATSPLEPGKWWTLGGVYEPSTGGLLGSAEPENFCEIAAGVLSPQVLAFPAQVDSTATKSQ